MNLLPFPSIFYELNVIEVPLFVVRGGFAQKFCMKTKTCIYYSPTLFNVQIWTVVFLIMYRFRKLQAQQQASFTLSLQKVTTTMVWP